MKVLVEVMLKNGVLDSQGRAVHRALEGMGFSGIKDLRVGKTYELDLDDSVTDDEIVSMCQKQLVNSVIERYHVTRLTG